MLEIEEKILKLYVPGVTSLREVADLCGTDHHRVKRVLDKNSVEVVPAKRKAFSPEHKKKLSLASKGRVPWSKGKTMSREFLCKNMATHIRFDVTWEWCYSFPDTEKLKFLNRAISNRESRWVVDTDWYIEYVNKFYYDTQFNLVYNRWLEHGKEPLLRPSIDHIYPIAKGGTNAIDNIQSLSWFENRCKNDMLQEVWDDVKTNIHKYLID